MQKGKPIVKFGVSGKNPKDAGRTPQWDTEEEAIFNPAEDDKFLKSNNITYTKDGIYYLNENGKYLPGIIYHSPNGNDWNHYSLTSNGITNFDKRNLSLDQYNLYKSLGINPVRFYENAEEAEFYRPNPNLKLPEKETKIGNSTITFKEGFPYERSYMGQKPNAVSRASLREYTDYGSWHVVDPDKQYDFTIRSGRLRDGGSRTINLSGKYPEEWNKYTGIIRYNGMGKDDGSAQKNRESLNKFFSTYGIQLDKQGGILKK